MENLLKNKGENFNCIMHIFWFLNFLFYKLLLNLCQFLRECKKTHISSVIFYKDVSALLFTFEITAHTYSLYYSLSISKTISI